MNLSSDRPMLPLSDREPRSSPVVPTGFEQVNGEIGFAWTRSVTDGHGRLPTRLLRVGTGRWEVFDRGTSGSRTPYPAPTPSLFLHRRTSSLVAKSPESEGFGGDIFFLNRVRRGLLSK